MKNITIPVEISADIMIALNESEQELKSHLQVAMVLFQEGKLTIGKATQLSGLTRYAFEKALAKNNISISNPSFEQVMADVEKLKGL